MSDDEPGPSRQDEDEQEGSGVAGEESPDHVVEDGDSMGGAADDGESEDTSVGQTEENENGDQPREEGKGSQPGEGGQAGLLTTELPFRRSRAILAALGLAGGGLLVGLLIYWLGLTGLNLVTPSGSENGIKPVLELFVAASEQEEAAEAFELVAGVVFLQGFGFGTTALLYVGGRRLLAERFQGLRPFRISVSIPSLLDVGTVIGGYVAAFGVVIATLLTVLLLGLGEVIGQSANQGALIAQQSPIAALVMIPVSIVLIGPGEELLFRGIVQRRLGEAFPVPVAVVLASLLFAVAHAISLTGPLEAKALNIAILVGPALVFGAAYEYTDNLVVPSLIHGCYNATLFTGLYFAATGGAMG